MFSFQTTKQNFPSEKTLKGLQWAMKQVEQQRPGYYVINWSDLLQLPRLHVMEKFRFYFVKSIAIFLRTAISTAFSIITFYIFRFDVILRWFYIFKCPIVEFLLSERSKRDRNIISLLFNLLLNITINCWQSGIDVSGPISAFTSVGSFEHSKPISLFVRIVAHPAD